MTLTAKNKIKWNETTPLRETHLLNTESMGLNSWTQDLIYTRLWVKKYKWFKVLKEKQLWKEKKITKNIEKMAKNIE